MLAAARRAVDYALSVEVDLFTADRMRVDATMAAVMIVGEASKRISVDGRREIPDVDWRALSDVRQYVVHKYFLVDASELHRAVAETIRGLVPVLERALELGNVKSSRDGGGIPL